MIERKDQADPTYRFVIYGRAKSGKTCYLAALAMARMMNPRGYTCDWLNSATDCRRPPGPEETWDFADPMVARFQGREWLQTGIRALEAGRLPPANPNEAAPFRYLFEFRGPVDVPGAPGLQRTFRVELIDYSGELIDPEISETQLARRVRQHMDEADGILVLAEAPRGDGDELSQHDELLRLRSAFHLIKKPVHGLPIALVINKWDRFGEGYPIEEFLARTPQPPHVSLIAALRSKVGEGDFQVFTASALGPCRVSAQGGEAGERPAQLKPMASYRLEDPFLWLAGRRDELRVGQIKEEAGAMHSWAVWQVANGVHLRLESLARAALPYVKSVGVYREALADCLKRNRVTAASQVGLLLATIGIAGGAGALWLISEADLAQFRRIAAEARTADIPDDAEGLGRYAGNLKQDDRWLVELTQGTFWRTASRARLSEGEISSALQDLRKRLEDCEQRKALLVEKAQAIDSLRSATEGIAAAAARANDSDRLKQARVDLDGLEARAKAEGLDSVLQGRFRDAHAAIDNAAVDLTDLETAKALRKAYNELAAVSDIVGAANTLDAAGNGRESAKVAEELRRDLLAKAEGMIQIAVEREVKPGSYQAAANILREKLKAPAVARLLGNEAVTRLLDMENEWIWKPQDRALYQQVRLNRTTPDSCTDYLEQSRLKEMETVVSRYRDFLKNKAKPQDYTLSVTRVAFGPRAYGNYKDYHAQATISVGGQQVIATDVMSVAADTVATSPGRGEATLRRVQRDAGLVIWAELKVTDNSFGNSDMGKSEPRVFSPEQLAAGVELPLLSPDEGNKIEIKLGGFQPEPPLPDFGKR